MVIIMRIYEKALSIQHILYVAKVQMSKRSYSTQNRESDGFVYVLSGSVKCKCNNKSFIAEKGNVIYLSEGSCYDIVADDDDYSFIVINFLFEKNINDCYESEKFVLNNSFELDEKFIKLNKLWTIDTTENKLKVKSIVYDIYSRLCSTSIKEYLPNESQKLILEISEIILANCFNSNLNITNILNERDISEVHFRRLFKKIYGYSPIKFVQNIRINKAKQLLIDDNLPINQIALKCGYDDTFYFSRIFKQVTGLTPREYRNTSQKYYR